MSYRYSAFISYSHNDQKVARWLHRAIEGYCFPKAVIGSETPFGPAPRKLAPVFRDRDELAASGDLGENLRKALAAARYQIVICSPSSARSFWVNEEIKSFKTMHGEHRTLALIVCGEPYSGQDDECFPEALRFRLAPDHSISSNPAEPIAADLRPGKDGSRLALLKLLAGISGVPLSSLARRDAARRQRRLMAIAATSSVVAIITVGLAIFAEGQRRLAVEQRDLAESSLDFLVGTFEIANPATENPKTITALTILERASDRAANEFDKEPLVASRLLRTTGEIYARLGLPKRAERDLKRALVLGPQTGEARAHTLLQLASIARARGDTNALTMLIDQAEQAMPKGGSDEYEIAAMIAEQRANAAFLSADYDRAAELFAEARRKYASLPGDFRAERANNYMNEAYALVNAQRFDGVDRLYSQATRLLISKYGLKDVRAATALNNQAFAALSYGRPDQAAARMKEALTIFRRVLEPEHPNLAAAELLMGRIKMAQNEPDQALENLANARRIFAHLYGRNNPAVADVDFYSAEAEAKAGRTEKAIALTDNVARIYTAAYGIDDPDQAELLLLRSRIHAAGRDFSSAYRDCLNAVAVKRRIAAEPASIIETRSHCNELRSDLRVRPRKIVAVN